MTERPYSDIRQSGRKDINGVEWWACDPYPTWYRWADGVLYMTDSASFRQPSPTYLLDKIREVRILSKQAAQVQVEIEQEWTRLEALGLQDHIDWALEQIHQDDEDLLNGCPVCGAEVEQLWSGVRCSDPTCEWWYCL